MSLQITQELFDKLSPKSNSYIPALVAGQEITLVEIDTEDTMKWGNNEVPKVILDGDIRLPLPIILGMVVENPDASLIRNKDTSDECVEFVGHTLHDAMAKKEVVVLPQKIKIAGHFMKGVSTSNDFGEEKKALYKKSDYCGAQGVEFAEGIKGKDFIPSIYQSAAGTMRRNKAYMGSVIEW